MPCNNCRKCDHCETVAEALEQMSMLLLVGGVCMAIALVLKSVSLAFSAETGSGTNAAMWISLIFGGIGLTLALVMAIVYAGKRTAQKFTKNLPRPKRTVAFVLAIAAEVGLLGIAYSQIGNQAGFGWNGAFIVIVIAFPFLFLIGIIGEIWDLNDADAE